MASVPLIAVLSVFGIIFLIGVIAVVVAVILHCMKSFDVCQNFNTVTNNTQVITLQPAFPSPSRNYVVSDKHLDQLISSTTKLRQPIDEILMGKDLPVEQVGITLEFLPDDNTVIKVESTDYKVTRITKTSIVVGDLQKTCTHNHNVHRGVLDGHPVSVHIIGLRESAYGLVKQNVIRKDQNLTRLTSHPRFIRYHGTCFHPFKKEAYIITDYFAGATLLDVVHEPNIKDVMGLSEDERIQVAADIVEALYFLHGHSPAIVHGGIGLACAAIDGETHRGKLMAPEVKDRITEILNFTSDGSSDNFFVDSESLAIQEKPPELVLAADFTVLCTEKSDIWSLGATVLQLVLDTTVWDGDSFVKKFNARSSSQAIKSAMELKLEPSILKVLIGANSKLQFLGDCLNYCGEERPTAAILLRRLNQLTSEVIRDRKKSSVLRNSQSSSFLFPGRRATTSPVTRNPDPLIKQQVEWNIKQESGYRRRALVIGIRNYLGKKFKSLSVTALNDAKDMTTLLQQHGFGLENSFENIRSSEALEDILSAYVEAVNKEPEEIDLLLFYFAGKAIQGLPKRLAKKQELGIFMDRVGVVHDLALVLGNETQFPVSKIQTMISELNHKVRRKLIILDCRITRPRDRFRSRMNPSKLENFHFGSYECDWDVATITEEAIEKLSSMVTIYPKIDDSVTEVAMDSHPTRTNGFMTGCLISLLKESQTSPYIEELTRALNDQMRKASKSNKAFRGIHCSGDMQLLDMDLWNIPLLGQK